MTSLTDPSDLRDAVDIVIGVDTHVDTHTAAVVDGRTGAVVAQVTVYAAADGYAVLVEIRWVPGRSPQAGHGRQYRRRPGA